MLTLEGVEVCLDDTRYRFDLALAPGDCVAVLGASGAGKSTLLNLIGGFMAAEAGEVRWCEQSLTALPPDQRPVTTLFQDHNLFAHLTVAENIGLGIHPGLRLTDADHARIAAMMEQVGLSGLQRRKPGALSGGQLQRAALARSLLRDKPILLLDEPFSALDAATRQEMQALTRRIHEQRNLCTILVTHHADDVAALDAHAVTLEQGQLRPHSEAVGRRDDSQ